MCRRRGVGDAALRAMHEAARASGVPLSAAAAQLVAGGGLKGRVKESIADLLRGFARWRELLDRDGHVVTVATVLDESGYTAMWQQDKSPEAPGRLENLKELVRALADFETLAGFLDHVSLVMENEENADGDRVSLMTLHGAKGLEFDTVFLPGWEEGLFPNQRALDEGGAKGLEEERRLAYVGLTRARRRAIVSHAANRRIYANWQSSIPSRFIDELPDADVERTGSAALARDARVTGADRHSPGQFPLVARRRAGDGGVGTAVTASRVPDAIPVGVAGVPSEVRLRHGYRCRGRAAGYRVRQGRRQAGAGPVCGEGVIGVRLSSDKCFENCSRFRHGRRRPAIHVSAGLGKAGGWLWADRLLLGPALRFETEAVTLRIGTAGSLTFQVPTMRCIFCLQERPGSEEHVFPVAIGGRLTTDRVCERCNSILGSRVDRALCDNFLIRSRRAQLGLAGNSGTVPAVHEWLLGKATLAQHPERRVQITLDNATGRLAIRALHHASDVIISDGSRARLVIVDEKDGHQIPRIIQRERKRHGVPPLSEEELAVETRRWTQSVTTIENPQLVCERSYSFAYLRHAMLKIAYELAFLWMGEAYLDDPLAADLRAAIFEPDPASTDRLLCARCDAEGCEAFKFWSLDKARHLAFALVGNDGITIAVRVFDIHVAIVLVTTDAARYLTGDDPGAKLRFLSIEPVSGRMHDTTIYDESVRIALAMTAARRAAHEWRGD